MTGDAGSDSAIPYRLPRTLTATAPNMLPRTEQPTKTPEAVSRASQRPTGAIDLFEENAAAFRFVVVRCICGEVVLEAAHFRGVIRIICRSRRGCGRRLLVLGDGKRVRVSLTARPNPRVN